MYYVYLYRSVDQLTRVLSRAAASRTSIFETGFSKSKILFQPIYMALSLLWD
jgi:hypothetical protein